MIDRPKASYGKLHSAFAPVLPGEHDSLSWGQLYGAAPALTLVEAARRHGGMVAVIAPSAREAERLEHELRFFSARDGENQLPVMHFPDWETLPYDAFSPHQDLVSKRIATLYRLPRLERGIVVITAGSLMQRLPPRSYVESGSLVIRAGQRLPIDQARHDLAEAGYACVSQVSEHGEFAVRGSLIDLFPMGSPSPFRIDLFDDEIETIRTFDPETQLTTGKRDEVTLLPAREFPLTEAAIRHFRAAYRRRFEGDPNRSNVYRDVSAGIASGGTEYYLPLFFEQTDSFFDYLPDTVLLSTPDDLDTVFERGRLEFDSRYEQYAHDIERPVLRPDEVCVAAETLSTQIASHPRVRLTGFEIDTGLRGIEGANYATAPPPGLPLDPKAEQPASALLAFLAELDGRVLFAAESAGRREHLLRTLRSFGLKPEIVDDWKGFLQGSFPLAIGVAAIERGLVLPDAGIAIVVEEQLLGERARQRVRRRPQRDPESLIRDLADLRVGAPVVHEEYGVGRYLGLNSLDVEGASSEFLTLEYSGGDRLYVPVQALDLITRYTGASPETAPLHKLGTDQWKRARTKAAKRIRDVAAELLDIYARREARKGQSIAVDERDYRAFEAGFPFEETPDQHETIESVIADLRSPQPMDRIVCGDVGFGKTEVAMRAAFVAAQAGKQCAVLVPTTLLAQQHYQTFSDRFADWPFNVEVLSRFRSTKDATRVMEGLTAGSVDIVIGTHRLLQGRIKFKDLGLLIIDEEHRFGVRHKEKLRAMRAEVDMLTLTATPIPRTLNMAMGRLRELSLMTTPPEERLAVKTFVSQWNPTLIREACLREIKRGGQIFFVHNQVETIEATAAKLAELVPEANIRIGHGQMRERDLERVMLDFYHRRFNVLACTTIVESGIDIPTANTIIINRADRFGLAQLHQLRGRVGRSHHRAYAYLIAPPRETMNADAVKRLEAIESLVDLGAGFALATHDLEIRGAGELLGDEQSGQIHEIGFALYTELLGKAVAALKAGLVPNLDEPLHRGPEVDLHVPALLTDDYMPDVHMRLVMYKRIASAVTTDELDALQIEMIDRFGLLPDGGKLLFRLAELKLRAAPLGIAKIDAGRQNGRIVFGAQASVDPARLITLLQADPRSLKLDGEHTLRFSGDFEDVEERFAKVTRILRQLAGPGQA